MSQSWWTLISNTAVVLGVQKVHHALGEPSPRKHGPIPNSTVARQRRIHTFQSICSCGSYQLKVCASEVVNHSHLYMSMSCASTVSPGSVPSLQAEKMGGGAYWTGWAGSLRCEVEERCWIHHDVCDLCVRATQNAVSLHQLSSQTVPRYLPHHPHQHGVQEWCKKGWAEPTQCDLARRGIG